MPQQQFWILTHRDTDDKVAGINYSCLTCGRQAIEELAAQLGERADLLFPALVYTSKHDVDCDWCGIALVRGAA